MADPKLMSNILVYRICQSPSMPGHANQYGSMFVGNLT